MKYYSICPESVPDYDIGTLLLMVESNSGLDPIEVDEFLAVVPLPSSDHQQHLFSDNFPLQLLTIRRGWL